jgi:uncharacterized protein YjeT (DUF2065 family)
VGEGSAEGLTDHAALHREKARLRWIGLVVLVVGLATAGIVYWHGTRAQEGDLQMQEYEQSKARAESRQMQMLYGTSGGLMQDFFDSMKQPANQAMAVGGISVVIAAVCFYLGRPLADDEEIH